MDIRIPLLIIIILGYYFFRKKKNGKKNYIVLVSALFILESGLRSMFFGPDDTYVYFLHFEKYTNFSQINIINFFLDDYVNHELNAKDPGFTIFEILFHYISDNYQLFLIFCAFFYFVPLGKVLNRYAPNMESLYFAYILHLALFHVIALCCLRQQIATGIALMIFMSVIDKKYRKAILLFIIGFTIHKSLVLILLPIGILLLNEKWLKRIHLLSFIAAIFVGFSAHYFVGQMAMLTANDYYMAYAESQGSGYVYLFITEVCSVLCYFFISRESFIQKSKVNKYLYCMLPCLTLTVPLIVVDGAMIRISQYYTIFLMLLLPVAFQNMFRSFGRLPAMTIAELILIAYILLTPFEYYFFWEKLANPYYI